MRTEPNLRILLLALAVSLFESAVFAAAPLTTALGSYREQLSAPARIAVAPSGQLFAVDSQAGRIVEFDPFGRVASVFSGAEQPLAVGHDAAGHVLVAEAGPGRVRRYDALWNVIGELGGGAGEFQVPNFLACDPSPGSNVLYVTDSAADVVKVYHGDTFAFSFGSHGAGAGQFDFPAGIWVTTNEVYVVDQNNDRVEVFDRGGTFVREFSLVTRVAPGLFGLAGGRSLGICGDTAGRLYVADSFQGLVKVYDATGTALTAIGALGEEAGQLRSPGGVCFDPLGRLFVASPNNGRIEMFGVDNYLHLAMTSTAGPVLAAGSDLVFSVSGPGLIDRTIQWQHGATNLADATNAVLQIGPLATGDGGTYAVALGTSAGTSLWTSVAVTVLIPPAISVQPTFLNIPVGGEASFSVAATGDALQFQWLRAGEPVAGGTNAILELSGVQERDAGAYAVTVSNAVGALTSSDALLRVLAPPAVVLQPVDAKALVGNTAQFDVAAVGTDLHFSWRFNGLPLFAPSLPVVTLPEVQPLAAGQYAVVVSNGAGVVTSAVATLSVFSPPVTQEVQTITYEPGLGARIRFVGDPGYRFTLDASLDLESWTTLTNTYLPDGGLDVLDADSATGLRFYRLRWHP